jgi:hypothetical protein
MSGAATLACGWLAFTVIHYHLAPRMLQRAEPNGLGLVQRAVLLYGLLLSVVSSWRGVWLLWDAASEHFTGDSAGLVSGMTR